MQAQGPVVLGMTGEQLQALITGIVGNLQPPPAPAPAPAPAHAHAQAPEPRNRLRIKEPDAFGGDRTAYRTWKSQMERYLAAHPQAAENDLITVVMSFIRGPTIDEWVNAYADQHFDANARSWLKTLGEVWDDLDLAYVDRIGEHSALQRMRDLKQRLGHAAEFFQEYEKLMWMAGMGEDDRMALECMKDGVHERHRHSIHSLVDMPSTYQEWKTAVGKLDDNYMRELAVTQSSRRAHAPQQSQRQAPRPQNQTQQAGGAGVPGRADATGITYGGQGQPMEIDRTRTGQCWRCGGRRNQPGAGCANAWHRAPQYQRPAPPAAAPPAPPQRFRGLTTEELTELTRAWAAEEPEEFRRAGFGQGDA